MALDEIQDIGSGVGDVFSGIGKGISSAAEKPMASILGEAETPENIQESAFALSDAQGRGGGAVGPSAQEEGAGGKATDRASFGMRGGWGNTVLKALKEIQSGAAMERHKKAFMQMNREGFAGAKKLYGEAQKYYPDISGWVPRPEYFLKTDGTFDTQKYHEAFQLGLIKYKQMKVKEANAEMKGKHEPAVQQAINAWYSHMEENPGLTADQAAAAFNQIKQQIPGAEYAEMPKEVYGRIGASGLATQSQREGREFSLEKMEKSHQNAIERIKLNNKYRVDTRNSIGDKDLGQNQLLNQLRYLNKERMKIEEQANELRTYERRTREIMPEESKKYGETAKQLEQSAKSTDQLIKDLIEEYRSKKDWEWLQGAGPDTDFDSVEAEAEVAPLSPPSGGQSQQPAKPGGEPDQSLMDFFYNKQK